jgi:ketosteroid isomerase-like protein
MADPWRISLDEGTLSPMAQPDNRDVIARFYIALNAKRLEDLDNLLDPDVVQEWPQSGERIRGLKNVLAVIENFPDPPRVDVHRIVGDEDKWVLTPTWTPLRTSGTGDTYTVECRITYPNGDVWSNVSILKFRNGKLLELTEYFAAPFPPAEWRAPWVEKVEQR